MSALTWETLPEGARIADRYRVVREIGSGGYGSVYAAVDERLSREVAVKVLHSLQTRSARGFERELRDRFEREAKIMGRIHHPNFVEVYDVGVDKQQLFLVMELVEGRSLGEELFRNGPMSPQRALPLFIDALKGLGEGHSRGIVHKDLKPDNLLLTRQQGTDRLKILDFGVARVAHEERITRTGLIVGTPQYFAPEYLTSGQVTPALDVYQMALILIEVISGQPCVPESMSFMQMCNAHFKGRLEIPAELTENDFGFVLRRATALDPGVRYHDANHFAQALSAIDPNSIRVPERAQAQAREATTTTYGEFDLRSIVPTHGDTTATVVWTEQDRADVQRQLDADRVVAQTRPQRNLQLRLAVGVASLAALLILALLIYMVLSRGA